MSWLGYVALFGFLALALVHRVVGRRYLDEYVAVYGRLPGSRWFAETDGNLEVERWRRRRLAVIIPELVLFLAGMYFLLTSS